MRSALVDDRRRAALLCALLALPLHLSGAERVFQDKEFADGAHFAYQSKAQQDGVHVRLLINGSDAWYGTLQGASK
jgi:hypothetical protein